MKNNQGVRQTLQKALLLILKISISASLLAYVLHRAGEGSMAQGLASVLKALRHAGIMHFPAAVTLFVLMIFLNSIRWGLLLGRNVGVITIFRLQLLGTFFSIFLPGMVGGDAIKAYYLHKMTGMGTEAVASVFMDRYLGYAALILLGLLAYPLGLPYFAGTWIVWVLPAMALAFAVGSLVVFWLETGGRRFSFMARIYGYFRTYRNSQGIMAKAMSIGLIVHTVSAILVYVLSRGLGESIPLISLMVFIPIVSTLAALPLSVGGMGIREGAMILLLGTQGVDQTQAVALSFLWYCAMAAGGAIGSIEYLRSKDYIRDEFKAQTGPGDTPEHSMRELP